MSHRIFLTGGLVVATLLAATLGDARAADLDYPYGAFQPPPLPETKVEFGTGWYVRGDLAATDLPAVRTVDNGVGAYPGITFGSGSHVGYSASLGAGYQFLRWLRADVTADFNEPVKSSVNGGSIACPTGIYYDAGGGRHYTDGGCYSTNIAKINSYDVLVNGYLDLGTWYRVTPYVGAGVGLGFGYYSATSQYTQGANRLPYNVTFTDPVTGTTYYNNYDKSAAGNFYNFAFALMAGFSVDVYDHVKLDVGYRYLHLGPVLGSTLYNHQVRAGLRYMIDN